MRWAPNRALGAKPPAEAGEDRDRVRGRSPRREVERAVEVEVVRAIAGTPADVELLGGPSAPRVPRSTVTVVCRIRNCDIGDPSP